MSKISREDNKKRYKTGMYPTQQDFENAFDSYVHKDDTIDPSQVMSGDENIIDIINRKAEEKHSHEMKDVNQLPETIQEVKDDIKQAEDDIAGASNRIDQTENVINNIETILGKKEGDKQTLKEKFAALGEGYSDIYTFINTVKSFLKDADVSDETINRWQEIESFLQGITDTETLTGLLADLKTEIQAKIPQGNYLKLVDDLDANTDETGTIAMYTGATNEKYTHGFIYEKVEASGTQLVAQEDVTVKDPWEYSMNGVAYLDLSRGVSNILLAYNGSKSLFTLKLPADNAINANITDINYAYLDVAYDTNGGTHVISINNEGVAVAEGNSFNKGESSLLYIRKSDNKAFAVANFNNISFIIPMRTDGKFDLSTVEVATTHNCSVAKDESGNWLGTVTFTPYYESTGTTSAWTLSSSMPVIR